jgi:hypothetical protein
MNCHLLIPSLFLPAGAGAEPYRNLDLPALETVLARGALTRLPGISLERWLAAAFRIAPQYDLPLAALSLRGEGADPRDSCWVRADPVHLQLYRDRLLLADSSCLEITKSEAAAMVVALNAHFRADDIEFFAPVPDRWYARLPDAPRILTTPTLEAAGRAIDGLLPQGEDGARWRRFLNEAQMILHDHPCNAAREARRQLPVNSVWPWGAGRLPEIPRQSPYAAVWSSQPLATGLARTVGVPERALPQSGGEFLRQAGGGTAERAELVLLDTLRGGEPGTWRTRLAGLEAHWFAPLLAAVKRGTLKALAVHALGPDGTCAGTYTRLDRYKWWRTRRPLAAYAP